MCKDCCEHDEYLPEPYIVNVSCMARQNMDFRITPWTGKYSQMTLMSIPVCSDIGLEKHKDTDQMIRIEQGFGLVRIGKCEKQLDFERKVCQGDVIFVPAGTWHNVINIGKCPLKISSVYAPPHHPVHTVHHTKEDSAKQYS